MGQLKLVLIPSVIAGPLLTSISPRSLPRLAKEVEEGQIQGKEGWDS